MFYGYFCNDYNYKQRQITMKRIITILAALIFIAFAGFATDYEVAGAGNAAVNGTYTLTGGANSGGNPVWTNGVYFMSLSFGWFINQDVDNVGGEYRSTASSDPNIPPLTGWGIFSGAGPAPTVAEATVCVEVADTFDVSIVEGDVYVLGDSTLYAEGTYVDTLQTTAGCDSVVTVNLIFAITTGISASESSMISIYPNPSDGVFTISSGDNYNYQILDINGRIISRGEIQNSTHQIDISTQVSGVYFIILNNETVRFIKR